MKERRGLARIMMFTCTVAALGTTTTCRDCDLPPDYRPPTLYFEGQVRTAAGEGLLATVDVVQRLSGCAGDGALSSAPVDSDEAGRFRVELIAASGLEGCFVVRAFSPSDSSLPLDSTVVDEDELHAIGDPLGSGVIPVDVIVRERVEGGR